MLTAVFGKTEADFEVKPYRSFPEYCIDHYFPINPTEECKTFTFIFRSLNALPFVVHHKI